MRGDHKRPASLPSDRGKCPSLHICICNSLHLIHWTIFHSLSFPPFSRLLSFPLSLSHFGRSDVLPLSLRLQLLRLLSHTARRVCAFLSLSLSVSLLSHSLACNTSNVSPLPTTTDLRVAANYQGPLFLSLLPSCSIVRRRRRRPACRRAAMRVRYWN